MRDTALHDVDSSSPSVEEPSPVVVRRIDSALAHHLLLLLFTGLWGGNFVLAEVALREMAPISFSVARFVTGGAAMLGVLYVQCWLTARRLNTRLRFFPNLDQRDWPRLVLVAILGATLAPWLGIEGLGLTDGARAALWLALGPVMSSAFGYMHGTERIGRSGYVGVVLACVGTLVLAVDGLSPSRNYWLGDLLLFVALLMVVWELHLIKPLAAKYGSTSMVAMRTLIGGVIYVLIATPALAGESWFSLSAWTWIAILAGGAIGVGVGQWVKVRALQTLGPTRVVLYGNLVPISAFLIAWLALRDQPSVLEGVAAAFILVGAICLQVIDPSNNDQKMMQGAAQPIDL